MAITCVKAGRPFFIPKVNVLNDGELELQDKFYEICSTFHYREIAGWSRILGVHTSTVERWKYKLTWPGYYIAQQIIEWNNDGRPWEKVESWKGATSML